MTWNALVTLVLANLLAWCLLQLIPSSELAPVDPTDVREAYPGRSEHEIRQIQTETWGRDYVYEPFTQFKEGQVAGDYVNVGASGFRRPPGAAPWPPAPGTSNVFVFGGSTTFGYGIADDETIPAALERHLRAAGCEDTSVHNLARSNYFSTQERILFEQLLVAGNQPSAAVFIDGLNEFMHPEGEPKFTRRLAYLLAENRTRLILRSLKQLPLIRLARAIVGTPDQGASDPSGAADVDRVARRIVHRWQSNRQLIRDIASSRDIPTLFVWQPVPGVGNSGRSPIPDAAPIPHADSLQRGYELLGAQDLDADTLWLADLPAEETATAYVDRVHYSAAFSSDIAREIAGRLVPVACP